MKNLILSAAAAAAAIAACIAIPASAQTAAPSEGVWPMFGAAFTHMQPSFYGTLGYADTAIEHVNLGAVQARLGVQPWRYFGIEAEGSWGLYEEAHDDNFSHFPERIASQEAIYAVGHLPISAGFVLLARVGYGHTAGTKPKTYQTACPDFVLEGPNGPIYPYCPPSPHDAGVSGDSWNYGVGAQYMFDAKNGVRADYIREAYRTSDTPDANVWSIAYVRKF